ncbi:MAG: zinc ribbon domain-containing protein [Chloroflexi bacterium]|nr:zinc ribbon domain-containing protein [Chloroflexota bacterium]
MPVYEYWCHDCKTKFEMLRPLSQSGDGAACPRCSRLAQRAMSRFASFSKSEGGVTTPVGGSSCGGCSATSCSSCGG